MKVIHTGATGMVGEGVLLACLENDAVTEVLSVSRRPCGRTHPKLKELLASEFTELVDTRDKVARYMSALAEVFVAPAPTK